MYYLVFDLFGGYKNKIKDHEKGTKITYLTTLFILTFMMSRLGVIWLLGFDRVEKEM